MYVDSIAILGQEKFKKFVLNYQNSIYVKMKELEEKTKSELKLLELSNSKDVNALLNAKSFFLSINPELESKFKTIEFYVANDAKNAEQVYVALDYILDSCRMHIVNNQNDNILKTQYLEILEKCDCLLKGDFSNLEFLQKMLEISNLSDAEKINVLAKIAYDSCILVKEKEETIPTISRNFDEIAYLKISELEKNLYSILRQKANEVVNRNYVEFIQNKNSDELIYVETIVKAIDKKEITIEEIKDFNYVREKMTVLLFALIKEREEIDALLDEFSKSVKADDVELLEETLKDFENMIYSIEKVETEIKQETKVLEENNYSSNIYFLLDEKGNLLFDLEAFHSDDKKKIAILMDKMQKGILDYDRGLKHTIVQSPHKMNFFVEVNKYSNFACIYIRIAKNKILVLSVGDIKDIFDEGIYIDSRYENRINAEKELINEDNPIELNRQKDILSYLSEELELGKIRQ